MMSPTTSATTCTTSSIINVATTSSVAERVSHCSRLACCSRDVVSGASSSPSHGLCRCFTACPRFSTYSAVFLVGLSTFLLFQQKVEFILTWLLDSGDAESFLFFLIIFTFLSFPMTWGYILVNVVAGYRFGLLFGTSVVMVCVAVGSTCAFVVSRSLLTGWIQRNLLNQRLEMIISVVEGKHGFNVIALTRLTPIPFGIQNGVFALSKIPISTFMKASLMGLLPTQLLNSYMGSTLRSVQDVRNQKSSTALLIAQVLISFGLSMYVIRLAQRELHKTLDSHHVNSSDANHNGAQHQNKSHHASVSLHGNDILNGGGPERLIHSNGTKVGNLYIV